MRRSVAQGKVRYASITLPYIAAIADDPHYQPPPLPENSFRERRTPAPRVASKNKSSDSSVSSAKICCFPGRAFLTLPG
jgi:hypothetical protein